MPGPAIASRRVVRVALALALTAPLVAEAGEVTFRVRDRVGMGEIEELTTLFIDGRAVGSFRLGPDARDVVVEVRVGEAESHDYALCGHVVVLDADGRKRRQEIDVSGTLFDVDGRDFEALSSDGFTRFYLVDTTPGREPARIEPTQRRACVAAVS